MMESARKLLITGAGGFVGQNTVDYFAKAGWQVYAIGRSIGSTISDPAVSWRRMELPDPAFTQLLREQQPDVLVHAASSAIVGRSIEDPLLDFNRSVDVWIHVIEAVRLSGIHCRVMLLSSAAVYGDPATLPISESHETLPISPYGYHKRMCEEIAQYYSRIYHQQVCSLRIFSAYGPGLRRQVIWDICQKARHGSKVELMGTGDETRDFIQVTDIARSIEIIAEHGDFEAGIYNVASGVSTTIRDVAKLVIDTLGTNNQIIFNGSHRSGDPRYWQADISRLTALGFRPQVSIDEGIRAYVKQIGLERIAELTEYRKRCHQ